MKHFQKIAARSNIYLLSSQVRAAAQLWDCRPARTFKGGPFEGTSDIWLRYREPEELTGTGAFMEPHFAVWYPEAEFVPEARRLTMGLAALMQATAVGGVMLTRIPAGGTVQPHHDRGSWHAETFNCKLYIPIETNPDVVNFCGDGDTSESVVMESGDVWRFDNLVTHSVENRGETDRVTLIVCLRVEI